MTARVGLAAKRKQLPGWQRGSKAGWLLLLLALPLSWLFRAAVWGRSLCYRVGLCKQHSAGLPVISVGNIKVGGTGKTPICRWLAGRLAARGLRVAIVSRGYGGRRREAGIVGRRGMLLSTVEEAGDEAVMLAKTSDCLVVTGRDRVQAARYAIKNEKIDLVLLDDGFQHRKLARDLDIVLVDGTEARSRLLPAGPLREPAVALARAQVIFRTCRLPRRSSRGAAAAAGTAGRETPDTSAASFQEATQMESLGVDLVRPTGQAAGLDDEWSRLLRLASSGCLTAVLDLVPQSLVVSDGGSWTELPLAALAGKIGLVVTGVADPSPLYQWLRQWEFRIDRVMENPDHHGYTVKDWQLIARAAEKVDLVVTTEKDLVKLEKFPFARGKLVAVRMGVVGGEERLLEEIMRLANVRARGIE